MPYLRLKVIVNLFGLRLARCQDTGAVFFKVGDRAYQRLFGKV